MDALFWKIIEAGRAADEAAELLTGEELSPVSYWVEAVGVLFEHYGDGSTSRLVAHS